MTRLLAYIIILFAVIVPSTSSAAKFTARASITFIEPLDIKKHTKHSHNDVKHQHFYTQTQYARHYSQTDKRYIPETRLIVE